MKVHSWVGAVSPGGGQAAPPDVAARSSTRATMAAVDAVSSRDKVSISSDVDGKALLMARVFRTGAGADVPVATVDDGRQPASHFLTLADRAQLARLYGYAASEGIDLVHVDALAADLAIYRQIGGTPVGQRYDLDGHGVVYRFSQDDEKTAARIRDKVSSTSSLDRGFLLNITDANQSPTHVASFRFIEQAVTVLSSGYEVGREAPPVTPGFDPRAPWDASARVTEHRVPGVELDWETGRPKQAASGRGGSHPSVDWRREALEVVRTSPSTAAGAGADRRRAWDDLALLEALAGRSSDRPVNVVSAQVAAYRALG